MVAFYVIRDEKTGKYYESRHCDCTLEQTRAHFARVEGAEKQIKKMQADGVDVSNWVIVPVSLEVDDPLYPMLMEQKSGWVIELATKDCQGKKVVSYWKGNKKKPVAAKHLVSLLVSLRGRPQTVTASIFATKAEAEKKIAEIVALRKVLCDQEKAERSGRHIPVDLWTGQPGRYDEKHYAEELMEFKFRAVEV